MKSFNSDIAVPLYQQLYDTIREQIRAGEFSPGDQIPSEDKLSEMYHISRVTVRSALGRLCNEHILVKRHGKGTFVALPVFVESVSAGGSFTRSCEQRGAVPSTRVLSRTVQPASSRVARRLGLCEGDEVICVQRIRLVDGVATILEVDYFRGDYRFLMEADITAEPLSDILFTHIGSLARTFEDTFDISRASRDHAAALGCTVGSPLLHVWQTVTGDHQQVLYCNEQYIMSEHYQYAVTYRAE